MVAQTTTKLTLDEARDMINRAVEKGEEVGYSSAWAVTDEGGNIISMSRMDGAPPLAMATARAKAYLSAILKSPTGGFSERMNRAPVRWEAYLHRIMSEAAFPGPGGMPITKDGRVVGGFSSSLAGARPPGKEIPKVDGEEVALEDYVTCYALQIPYKSQH